MSIPSSRFATTDRGRPPGCTGCYHSSQTVQLQLPFGTRDRETTSRESVEGRIDFVRVRNARRYILRVRADGTLRITIPRSGSRAEAIAFMGRHLAWITKERARVRREQAPVRWTDGTDVFLDGIAHPIVLRNGPDGLTACYADRFVLVRDAGNVRPEIEADLRALARQRLVPRLTELAGAHGLEFSRVTIRAQRSRWGSCSRRGAIALNFRLIQMPPAVCDYVLIHELMHLRQQNHGPRFWALVERACPDFHDAERWLRRSGRALF
jgi:predicted metal-dependent hydrolase